MACKLLSSTTHTSQDTTGHMTPLSSAEVVALAVPYFYTIWFIVWIRQFKHITIIRPVYFPVNVVHAVYINITGILLEVLFTHTHCKCVFQVPLFSRIPDGALWGLRNKRLLLSPPFPEGGCPGHSEVNASNICVIINHLSEVPITSCILFLYITKVTGFYAWSCAFICIYLIKSIRQISWFPFLEAKINTRPLAWIPLDVVLV